MVVRARVHVVSVCTYAECSMTMYGTSDLSAGDTRVHQLSGANRSRIQGTSLDHDAHAYVASLRQTTRGWKGE